MKELWLSLAVLATVSASAKGLPAAPEFRSGREVTVAWPGLPNDIKVFVPINYTPTRTWPCIFYYHGTNGLPRTDVMLQVTKGRDYIVVGMEYHLRGRGKMSPEDWEKNQQNDFKTYTEVRKWLSKYLKIDQKRVYMGGASKGGWATAWLGELGLKDLAGLIILMGGRHHSQLKVKDKSLLKGKRIYIGVGETDLNNGPSHWGAEFYRKYGAKVCLEEYMGLGHSLSFKSGLMADWLEVEGRLKDRPKTMAQELQKWIEGKTKAINAETDPTRRYHMLNLLRINPKAPLCSKESKQKLQTLWKEATKPGTPGASERDAERAFSKLVLEEYYWWRRQNVTRITRARYAELLQQLRGINRGYTTIKENFPGTRFAKRAAAAQIRIAPSLEHMKEKNKEFQRKTGSSTGATMGSGGTRRRTPVPRE